MEELAINGGKPALEEKIGYSHQYIDEEDIDAVIDVLKSDYLTCGPEIEKAEKKLCDITGARYAVLVSNGTAALHSACNAAGFGVGDEVITTPMTFAASANCILYEGAKPVFADIDPYNYNIDVDDVKNKITDKTKGIIAVDFTGQAAKLDELRKICSDNKLVLIEDAAHSVGTKYNEKYVGNIADLTTFSFHPVKNITSGEGGAILTNDEDYYNKIKLFRTHGITRSLDYISNTDNEPWYYEQISLGMNYRITDIQAALLNSQLNKLDKFISRKKEIISRYNEAFSKIPQIFVQKEIPESDTARHLYILRLRLDMLSVGRKDIYNALVAENVGCNVHYIPVYYFPYYQKLGYRKGLCPEAEKLYNEMITIPLYYGMSDEDVDGVINAVNKVVNYYKL